MLKLYSYRSSGNCYKVRLLLSQRAIPHQVVEIDVPGGEQRQAGHLARNPQGRVPVIEFEDGSFLSESGALLYRFAQDSPLWPETWHEQALVMQWMFFEQNVHEPHIAGARFMVRYLEPDKQDPVLLAEKRRRGREALQVMESHLQGRRFMVGERYTIADIALYAYTHVADEAGLDLGDFPAIRRWLEHVAQQPGHIPMTAPGGDSGS